jgi:hypothetical protein
MQILCRGSLQGGPFKEEKEALVINGVKAEVEAIEKRPLELNNDFILHLHNVLF